MNARWWTVLALTMAASAVILALTGDGLWVAAVVMTVVAGRKVSERSEV